MTIPDLRHEIDVLDTQLVSLIDRRLALSRAIQAERIADGGPRVVHAREAEVVQRWRTAYGGAGSRIALALLELSRGPLAPRRGGDCVAL